MKIIINALSGIGDALMFSPALKVLKSHIPDSQIDMMVMFKAVLDLYENNSAIDRIYLIDFLEQGKLKSLKQVLSLRKNKYDASINVYPANRREYNMINFLLGAKKRIAHRYNHYSFSNLHFLNNCLINEVKDRHNVLEDFDLVKIIIPSASEGELGNYDINIRENESRFAERFLQSNGINDSFIVGYHAGSATFKRHINKRWGVEKFAELGKKLNEKYNAKIILFGTEKDVNDSIFERIKDISFVIPPSNIMQSAALMKKCSLFVSNDAALMHIASALQIPVAAIFGYTNYNELKPWKSKCEIVRKELDCSPCFFNSPKPVNCIYNGADEFKCMKLISVGEVFDACEKLVKEIPGNIKS